MSDVTAPDVIAAVARAYGFSIELVKAGGGPSEDDAERKRRLEARMVAVHLLDRHCGLNRFAICRALGMTANGDSYELIGSAMLIVPRFMGYDVAMATRVEKAERRIDELHERRLSQRLKAVGGMVAHA